ncbi:hypothetical protein DFH09DRAFT_1163131 [Mycena vulgaris]|nr:hypothetical protein DFH09DRAFT_1163131 [Mycena vulgaris]
MEMSADSKYQTNLMDHDSEMQHMMKDFDSYEGDSGPRPVSFPPSRGKPSRPGSSHAHSRMSYNGTRPLSQTSTNSGTESQHDQPDHIHELEREWNKPHLKALPKPGIERHLSHGAGNTRSNSPTVTMNGHARVRTRSGGSVRSIEDSVSSKGTSAGSHSDYKERILELEKERNAEREHAWNRPQVARSTSALSVHSPAERSRKLSHPLRPGSSQSSVSPAISRRHSASSSHTSSGEEEEIQHEIQHERERNWGAPIPRWHQHGHHNHSRSTSPLPPSPSASTSSNLRPTDRVRAESLRTRGTTKGDSPIHRNESPRPIASTSKIAANAAATPHPQIRPKSLLGSNSRPRPMSYPARPNSPLPPPLEGKTRFAIPTSSSSFAHRPPSQPRSPERERGHSRVPSSPSPSPGKRPASRNSIISHIPVRSPAKTQNKSSSTINGHSRIPAESHSSDAHSLLDTVQVPKVLKPESECSPPDDQGHRDDPFTDTDEEEQPPEDRTPTLGTILPPTERPEPARQNHSSQPVAANDDDVLFQKALALAPPPSPPASPSTPTTSAPPDPTTTTILGLSTPPKRPSFHSSRLEFQTPSPPHGLPELPGPPSSSDEETETERPVATPLRFNGAPDMTSTKTPRPPGAWASTPAPAARTHSLPPPENDDSDSQYENGLATPVASLSRASSFPAQTPKPPGGWVATPAPRKSILKVRFNPQPSELELSATEDLSSANGHPDETTHASATGLATPDGTEESLRVHTPELPPASPSRSPRRSPIRVVDEYGRPEKLNPVKSPKNGTKNPVRIVDAMGEPVQQSVKLEPANDVPLNHNEALRVMREGVKDLVQGLDEMDISGDFVLLDDDHLRDLDNASRAAREARHDLKQSFDAIRSAKLRASMQHSKRSSEMLQQANSPRSPPPRIWFWTFIISFQALFIFMLYRFQKKTTRELFLTTYYDPFYPDLHLYGIRYDYLSFPRAPPSIVSLSHTLRQDGFKAFFVNIVDTAVVLFADWRADTWRKWGADDMRSVRWLPT